MNRRENTENESKQGSAAPPHRIFSDLHIHSRYSRATSMKMDLESIAHFAQSKGLNVVGTGDFTHPQWLKTLKETLSKISDTNLYRLPTMMTRFTCFMVTGEVCTIFESDGKTKKIHHLLLVPTLEIADQLNDKLHVYGDLSLDGRPILHMSASELVETVMGVSRDAAVIPAHVWTPWYSLFGSKNGFDRIEDCYEDATKHIFALETGLSSDPPMNWRLKALDRFTLVSNSDSHSPYPYRLGREANVFDIANLSYTTILDAIRTRDPTRFRFTVETNPAYGKYHWTGHRHCGVAFPPAESKKLGGRCPVCRRPMTRGVDERVEELADRPPGVQPHRSLPYVHLLPLHEAIGAALNVQTVYAPSVWRVFYQLIAAFGNEYSVLLDIPLPSLEQVVEPRIADVIVRSRNRAISVIPGYDGVYGKIHLVEASDQTVHRGNTGQTSLAQFL